MTVSEAIEGRRGYRSLEPVEITGEMVGELAGAASLAPSCFNRQPWRFVFVRSREALDGVFSSLSRGNEWFRSASMVVGVFSAPPLDCIVARREYYLFDTGLAVGMMLLKATDMGLIAHPIAGFDEDAAKRALGLGEDALLITLIAVGKRAPVVNSILSPHQIEAERERPPRMPFEGFAWLEKVPRPGQDS
jgi:nitroreductase